LYGHHVAGAGEQDHLEAAQGYWYTTTRERKERVVEEEDEVRRRRKKFKRLKMKGTGMAGVAWRCSPTPGTLHPWA
jgi:hypothetical protein